ncbi:2-amino-4-hydroxy-6-hydroxymethyldihydropteridine diphosphokinase [Nakamurella antarctica]|uniref:2-amino-4-hydroxy-6-hydroxymethyldihydropteridine diphosphokinase n=1 Tax=Nakamurella antarctica TaxID=1902245 RepID=A0A3G8ZY22_9ACTN|nr:2-amino-4-hydroxy-6-hydroxymethyldihydropteridine diphosphokinase [Nakamurella antarctica]AZI58916.1 2-amino-4-hydroxy-6-hydroxymethyldihydropteridine diphosphokinase [Nakamurella antarctica]
MTRAVLSLGSNLGDRGATLAAAVSVFAPSVVATSSVFQTPPWGPVEQDDFYNLVLIVSADGMDAAGWLALCHRAEQAAGRERLVRWGPRTLDADVIAVWDEAGPVTNDDPVLTLPHPRAFERAFVLAPWLEVEPDAELPGHGPIVALLRAIDATEREAVRSIGPLVEQGPASRS